MDSDRPRFTLTLETSLYLALFAGALALRLYRPGAAPLTDREAHDALIALWLSQGQAVAALAHSPAYVCLAFFSQLLFGASEAAARLGPALAGAALVFLPLFFRDQLGRPAALVAGLLLAVSSSLLAGARTVDSPVLALAGLGLGLGALRRQLQTDSSAWQVAAGVALGLGLAAGGSFLTGLLICGVVVLVVGWVSPAAGAPLGAAWSQARARVGSLGVVLVLAALGVSTVGALYLPGLGALAESALAWGRGLAPTQEAAAPQTLLLFLLSAEPLLVIFGLLGAWRAFRTGQRFAQGLAWLSLVALVVVSLYGSRATADVLWVSLPLALLAAWGLVDSLQADWAGGEWAIVAAQAGVSLILLAFAGINLVALGYQSRLNPDIGDGVFSLGSLRLSGTGITYLYLFLVAVALVIGVALLFGLGWSRRVGRLGLMLSVALAALAMTLSAGWGLTQLRPDSPAELWRSQTTARGLQPLQLALENVSNYNTGMAFDLELTVQAPADGALAWALRRFTNVRFVDTLGAGVSSPVVITPEAVSSPELGSAYVGQRFVYRYRSTPALASMSDWAVWLAFRSAPVQAEHVILWVRQDVQQPADARGSP